MGGHISRTQGGGSYQQDTGWGGVTLAGHRVGGHISRTQGGGVGHISRTQGGWGVILAGHRVGVGSY